MTILFEKNLSDYACLCHLCMAIPHVISPHVSACPLSAFFNMQFPLVIVLCYLYFDLFQDFYSMVVKLQCLKQLWLFIAMFWHLILISCGPTVFPVILFNLTPFALLLFAMSSFLSWLVHYNLCGSGMSTPQFHNAVDNMLM